MTYGLLLTDRWIAVGVNGNIAESPSGQADWNSFVVPGTTLRAVAYGSPGFVAVGDTGRILLSPTGINGDWTDQTSGTSNELTDVTYGNGIYVIVGGIVGTTATILTSLDGVNWTDRSIGLGNRLDHVLFANNQFYAVGQGGVRATSLDGIIWINANAGPNPWAGLAFGNGIFLIADDASNIHTSATFAGFPNPTGSFTSAVTDAVIFVPERGFFFLAGDGGETFTTTNGIGAATQGGIIGTVAYEVATNGFSISIASQGGSIQYSTDFSNFSPAVVGANDWFGITYARAPKILGP
ncbi:MAG TPA: hypothetical protein DEA96_04765 [Leptospiraceae bacterium]|nr:hypothetical protein [Spirochaetaceae bacterium]HBS04255.1 hypothetical protein [Leptospiraceae bacterium]